MTQDSSEDAPARRRAMGRIGATLIAAPLLAPETGAAQGGPAAVRQTALQNPKDKYPRPPYPVQTQEFPGLAGKMTPRPDHGETSYVGSGRLVGRKALITGGDSGIGRAAAIAYAREGADVAINYLPIEEPDAREVIELIRAAGRKAVALPGDIRDEAFCKQLVEQAMTALGGLDILVNNAGKQVAKKSILEITTEQFDSIYKTNVYAMFWISKAAIPYMPPGSTIINTGSEQAFDPSKEIIDYASTKAAIVNFSKGLAKQLVEKGIRVNAVAPGPFWTPLQPSGGALPEKLPQFGATAPLGRAGQPAEIAPLYVTLASQEASYTTGNVHGSTGGNPAP